MAGGSKSDPGTDEGIRNVEITTAHHTEGMGRTQLRQCASDRFCDRNSFHYFLNP